MQCATFVFWGGFVLLLWLQVGFFDRIVRWRTPWDRWARVRPNVRPVLKVMLIGAAAVASVFYALVLAAWVTGMR